MKRIKRIFRENSDDTSYAYQAINHCNPSVYFRYMYIFGSDLSNLDLLRKLVDYWTAHIQLKAGIYKFEVLMISNQVSISEQTMALRILCLLNFLVFSHGK